MSDGLHHRFLSYNLFFQRMKRENPDLQTHTRKQRHQRKRREPHSDAEGEIYTDQRGGAEEQAGADGVEEEEAETDTAPDPVYDEEEEERSGDDGWEDDDGEGEEEDVEMKRERERQREEWERRRAEMERGREGGRESGEPYPYLPHFYLKVLSHTSRQNKRSIIKHR